MGRCEECEGLACTHTACGGTPKDFGGEALELVETPSRVSARGSICTLL
jgi:hypothetical protein